MMYWVIGLLEEQTVATDTSFESEKLSLSLHARFLRHFSHLNLIPELRGKNFEEKRYEIRQASFTKPLQNDTLQVYLDN